MRAERFIADKIRFKGRASTAAAAISALVVTVAVCVSAGFRMEIRSAVGSLFVHGPEEGISLSDIGPEWDALPAFLIPAMICGEGVMEGVVFRGDSLLEGQSVRMGEGVARKLSASVGTRLRAYFFSEGKVKARVFEVGEIRSDGVDAGSDLTVYASEQVLRRVARLQEGRYPALEVRTGAENAVGLSRARAALAAEGFQSEPAVPNAGPMYDWLKMIDANVTAILALMIMVAGFNMMTGLLILLMRHVKSIGILKALGMTDREVAGVFVRVGSRATAIGLLTGTLLGLLLCTIQRSTHFLTLDPANYFLSYVPVHIPFGSIVLSMLLCQVAVSLLLFLPCKYISRIDPSKTIKSE